MTQARHDSSAALDTRPVASTGRTPRLPTLGFHPLAQIFPMMEGAELAAFNDDVAANGVIEKILLLEGLVFDGRHRYLAACAAGIADEELPLAIYEGPDPLAYVISRNLHRRHLTDGQRAMVAAAIANLGHGGARNVAQKPRARSEPSLFPTVEDEQAAKWPLEIAGPMSAVSQAEAGTMMNVPSRSVRRAKVVTDHGSPALNDAAKRGLIPVSTAAEIAIVLPKTEQERRLAAILAPVEGESDEVRQKRIDSSVARIAKETRLTKQAARHIERQEMGEALAANQPGLPGRLFSFVLVDVPRKHETYDEETGSEKAPENHYPVMEFHELVDFPIDSFAAPDSIIAHWSTAASLIDDLEILAQWGFVSFRVRDEHGRLARGQDGRPLPPQGGGKYGSHQIWHKRRAGNQTGMGRWFRDMHEVLILARRGNLDLVPAPLPGTQAESVFVADWAGHSVKPGEQIREWINRCWPLLSKVEIFARGEAPPGWVFWGNQAVRSPEAGPAAVSTSEFVCGIAYEKPAEKDVRTSKGHDSLEIPAFLRRKAEEQIPPAGAPA